MKKDHLNTTDFNLWHTIREETAAAAAAEPMLASFLHQTVLRHDSLDSVLAYHLSSKLGSPIRLGLPKRVPHFSSRFLS